MSRTAEGLLPSTRYLTLIRNGAKWHNLHPTYLEYLNAHAHNQSSITQKLYLLACAIVLLPLVITLILTFLFARRTLCARPLHPRFVPSSTVVCTDLKPPLAPACGLVLGAGSYASHLLSYYAMQVVWFMHCKSCKTDKNSGVPNVFAMAERAPYNHKPAAEIRVANPVTDKPTA